MRVTQSESNLHTPTAPKASSRSYRACTWCRAHKRKCDGLEPCTTCSNSPDGRKCEYAPPQKRGRKIKRQYDDKLSIEHVIKRRQDDLANYPPDVLPGVFDNNKPLGSNSNINVRMPENRYEGPALNIYSQTPIELPPPVSTRVYLDSLTSPQRYNYSSKYSSLSSPEIRSRVYSTDSLSLPPLPQIWTDDNISRVNSFTILPSPRQSTFYDSLSSSPSLSGDPVISRAEQIRGGYRDSDFIATTNRGGSLSHPLMLSTRRWSLQNLCSPISDSKDSEDNTEIITPRESDFKDNYAGQDKN